MVRRSAQTSEKCSILSIFLSIFSRLRSFPKVFGQVKEWLILESHEMIRVPHVVAFPTVSILSDVGKEECSKS